MLFFTFIVSITILLQAVNGEYNPSMYKCGVCVKSVAALRSDASKNEGSLLTGCKVAFPDGKNHCNLFFGEKDYIIHNLQNTTMSYRDYCIAESICASTDNEDWRKFDVSSSAAGDNLDIRVSKGLGTRPYNQVRISLIANTTLPSSTFSYTSQFKYRWTDKYLHTGIYSVTPGQKTTVPLTSEISVDVYLPPENTGTRGIIAGDPCITSEFVVCELSPLIPTFNYSTQLYDAIASHDDVHFFHILGDNFYDQDGLASASWFAALSPETKRKVFQSVPGNHDTWVHGSPSLRTPADQLGNGFMQYYGQDVVTATDAAPYDFSKDPDKSTVLNPVLPAVGNFFFYNKIGNIGFLGNSGAYDFVDHGDLFNESCAWAEGANLDAFVILNHWNKGGDGCPSDASAPSIYQQMIQLPACKNIAAKMKYFMGHVSFVISFIS